MRRLLVFVSTIVFVDAMLYGALTPLVPGYAEEFDLSKTGAGLLLGAFGAGALVGGIPGGLLALRRGPRWTVVVGLLLLAGASFAFAIAGGPWSLGLARFVQGASSAMTFAGSLAWLTVSAPADRRGQTIGTAFGAAVLGAIVGPMFGALADLAGIGVAFVLVGAVSLVLVVWAWAQRDPPRERQPRGAVRRAVSDRLFVGGLWLNALPAFLFGALTLLGPLSLDAHGFAPLAIGAVFLAVGLLEAGFNPILGRYSDRVGRLRPVRLGLAAAVVVSVALALADSAVVLVILVGLAGLSYGAFFTPGMALVSDRAERAALAQGLAFGITNSAWAAGELVGPVAGGWLADLAGDAATYLLCAGLCLATLAATQFVVRGRTASSVAA